MHNNNQATPLRLPRARYWLSSLIVASAAALATVAGAQAAGLDCSTPGTKTFDLYAGKSAANAFTLVDGTTVGVWGYTAAVGAPTAPGGPTLVACEGDAVTVTLHNGLGQPTSLALHGQGLGPDASGVADGSTGTYNFTAHAGTYLYQAGLTVNGDVDASRQAAMGLYGVLEVYPATAGQAYGTADTKFDAEQVVVLSEIDKNLNADPAGFDMKDYSPTYWLINGKSSPQTTPISAPAGGKLLLRYVNAGFKEHSMSLLGLDQTIIAQEGATFPYSHDSVAETVPPSTTMDAILSIPAGAGSYSLFDANQHLDNNGGYDAGGGLGGMVVAINAQVVVPPTPTAASYKVSCDTPTTTTAAVNCTVVAVDGTAGAGNSVAGYTGTAHFTSSDAGAALPGDYTFTAADAGSHTFSGVTFANAGSETFTATDTANSAITGSVVVMVPLAPTAASFNVACGTPATTTAAVSCTVTAVDGTAGVGNTVVGYSGTVHFTSSDGGAVLPGDYTFTATDAGVHAFSGVAFTVSGSQTLTVTDTAAATLTGSTSVTVP